MNIVEKINSSRVWEKYILQMIKPDKWILTTNIDINSFIFFLLPLLCIKYRQRKFSISCDKYWYIFSVEIYKASFVYMQTSFNMLGKIVVNKKFYLFIIIMIGRCECLRLCVLWVVSLKQNQKTLKKKNKKEMHTELGITTNYISKMSFTSTNQLFGLNLNFCLF